MKTVSLLTDDNYKYGYGNFIRTKSLFLKLKKEFKNIKFNFFLFSKLKKKVKSDLLITDLPNKNYPFKKMKNIFFKKNTKVISLDHTQKWRVDANISIFKKSNNAKKNFIGLKYCIIRKELKKKTKKNKNFFLISIGSNDLKNKSFILRKIFKKYFKNIVLTKKIKKKNLKTQTYLKNFSNYVRYCSLAACNGGATMLELLYHKKLIFVYPQNKNEYRFANYLKKKGCVIYINKYKISRDLFNNIKKIKQKNIIDSNGLDRISKLVFSYSE